MMLLVDAMLPDPDPVHEHEWEIHDRTLTDQREGVDHFEVSVHCTSCPATGTGRLLQHDRYGAEKLEVDEVHQEAAMTDLAPGDRAFLDQVALDMAEAGTPVTTDGIAAAMSARLERNHTIMGAVMTLGPLSELARQVYKASGGRRPTKRDAWIAAARTAGYHSDTAAFTRLLVEARVGRPLLHEAWGAGRRAREDGVPCGCPECRGPS